VLRRIALHTLWIGTALQRLLPSAADPDLWGHLLFGSLLLGGQLPAVNGFAYTAAAHPWINHEILAEATMAAVFNAFGTAGLVGWKLALGAAALLVLWRTALRRSGHEVASALATAAAAVVMTPGLMIRPQLFTLLFLALTLAILSAEGYRPRGAAWLLPLLVGLWVNTHGGVLAGVGLATIGVAGALAARWRRGEATRRDAAASAALAGALAAALFVNPYGGELVRFLLTDVTPRVPITEWAPVGLGDLSFPAFKALLVAVAVQLCRARSVSLPEALVVAAAALAALLHRRHIPLFAIAAAPLLAALLADAWHGLRERLEAGARARLCREGLLAVAALQAALALATGLETRGRIVVDARYYPVQAVRFLAQNEIAGNLALPFRWGEYALWSLPAGTRVAVDGRFTTAYPAAVLEDAWRFMTGAPGWDALLEHHPTDLVLADRSHATARLLRGHPDWEYVYSDPVSVVFVRRAAAQAETLRRFHAGALLYDRTALDTDFPAAPVRPAGACSDPAPARAAKVWRAAVPHLLG